MTRCQQCHKPLAQGETACPYCGAAVAAMVETYQSSTVMISSGGADLIYRSVEEVPAALRNKLLESTNGGNAGTILIADQRGRREIARAMRSLPGQSQRRLLDSMLGREAPPESWLTPARKRIILGLVALMVLATLALVFAHRWL